MTLRRASMILPCRRLEDFPTHLAGREAAELLAGWTALWHPSLVHATGALPSWHSADEPPETSTLEGELVLVPSTGRQRMASDWCDRLRATAPLNPPPVEAAPTRNETMAALLAAVSIEPQQVAADVAADFSALGHAHLQVELLTRAMRYTTVLDNEQFTRAVVAAAGAAVGGDDHTAREELARAFDLLADARNHVYSVDFYVIDITLLAGGTLGEALRVKLAADAPTNLLATGELIERIAHEYPETLAEIKRAIETGTACVVGGMHRGGMSAHQSPESLLADINLGQQVVQRYLGRAFEVFAQFDSSFSPLLPDVLKGNGFRGALHAAFDGGPLPQADQCKTNWGSGDGSRVEALAASPLDAARPETWLKFAQRIADAIAHDHVATVLLAGWPGAESEYFDDLRRAARYNSVLGKLVTLEEYFRITREPDDWTSFHPREYPTRPGTEFGPSAISKRVDAYRRDVFESHRQLCEGLAAAGGLATSHGAEAQPSFAIAINPWNSACAQFIGLDPLTFVGATGSASAGSQQPQTPAHPAPRFLPDVPGCGYATIDSAESKTSVELVEGLTLRNEQLEVTISERTGGIQSIRTHRDRSTRVSQRLVFRHPSPANRSSGQAQGEAPALDTQMIADRIETTRNDALVGEITSSGRLLDSAGQLLAQFKQTVRAARGLPAMIVDVQLDPERWPEGDIWNSYFASRLAFRDEPVSIRRGDQWLGRETSRVCIESPEWVEFDDGIGTVTCFAFGLPFHRRAANNWFDTLLLVAGEERCEFQFAIGIDTGYPTKTALGLLTAGKPYVAKMSTRPASSQGWFLHVSAKNVLVTHIEPLGDASPGVRLRLLETEGRDTRTTLAAFRPIRAARITDFRGNSTGVLSVVDGSAEIDIGPHRWIQIEAEW